MNNLTIELQNVSDEDKKILMEIVKRSNAPKDKVWKPIDGETYYYLDEVGIGETKWSDDPYQDTFLYEIDNRFRTEEEAEEEIKRRKFLKRWEDMSAESGESKNEWNGDNKHWLCFFNTFSKQVGVIAYSTLIFENVYFTNRESLENAINEIGEENVKRYILGVKE